MSVIGRPLLINAFGGTKSGDIVSFGSSLKVGIEPVQDLHGYENPWPAGGSLQLIPTFEQDENKDGVTLKVNDDGSVTLNGTATATTRFLAPVSTWQWDGVEDCWLSGCPAGGDYQNGYSLRIDADNSSAYSYADTGSGVRLSARSGSINSVNISYGIVIREGTVCTNLTFKPMLNTGLSAQPFRPYSNICPISGHEGVDIVTSAEAPVNKSLAVNPLQDLHGYDNPWPAGGGKNLADFVNGEGLDSITGKPIPFDGRIATINPIAIENGKSYVFYILGGQDKLGIYSVFNGDTLVRRVAGVASGTTIDTSDGDSLYVCVYSNVTVDDAKAMVCLSTVTDTTYAPYSNICPITPGLSFTRDDDSTLTIWGGVLDPFAKKITATKAEVDLGTLDWLYYNGYFETSKDQIGALRTTSASLICSKYAYTNSTQRNGNIYQTASYIRIIDNAYSDAASFKTASSGVQLVYELATPVEYTLSDTELARALEALRAFGIYIAFPAAAGTVYGGTLTVNGDGSGTLVVDRAMVDLGTLSWYRTTSYAHPVFYANLADAAMNGNQICSILKNVGGASGAATFSQIAPDCSFSKCIANSQVFVRYDIYTTTADFTTAMSGVQLVYELATPVTYTMTPEEVGTILLQVGRNNIWADTGPVTFKFFN